MSEVNMVQAALVLFCIAVFILEKGECKKRCFSIHDGTKTRWLKSTDVSSDFQGRNEEDVFERVHAPAALKAPEDLKIEDEAHKDILKTKKRLLWKSDDSYRALSGTKYFLLKIHRDEADNKPVYRRYWYILLGPFTAKEEYQFFYKCLPKCTPGLRCGDMKITLWALPNMKSNDGKRTYRNKWKNQAALSIRTANSTLAKIQQEAETCHCQAKIVKVQLVRIKKTTLTTTTLVNNKHVEVKVQFYLVRNGDDTVKEWVGSTATNQSETKFVQTFNVKPGSYVLKAEKFCNNDPDYSLKLSCDKDDGVSAVSNLCTIQSPGTSVSDVEEAEGDTLSTLDYIDATKSALKHKDGASTSKQTVTLMVSIPVVGVLFLVIAVSLTCIYCCDCRREISRTVPNTTALSQRRQRNQELVAVIYVNECSLHRRRVYNLCGELESRGIRVLPIDEHTRNREMIQNWIAEGERLSNACGSFLFVLSRSLVEACRAPYHNPPTTGSTTDETPPPVGHSRLPLVVLNSIKTRALFNDVRNVQTVYFENVTDSAVEGRDLCSQFTDSHSSIVSSETFKIGFLDDAIIRNQDLSRLVHYFRNTTARPFISYIE